VVQKKRNSSADPAFHWLLQRPWRGMDPLFITNYAIISARCDFARTSGRRSVRQSRAFAKLSELLDADWVDTQAADPAQPRHRPTSSPAIRAPKRCRAPVRASAAQPDQRPATFQFNVTDVAGTQGRDDHSGTVRNIVAAGKSGWPRCCRISDVFVASRREIGAQNLDRRKERKIYKSQGGIDGQCRCAESASIYLAPGAANAGFVDGGCW